MTTIIKKKKMTRSEIKEWLDRPGFIESDMCIVDVRDGEETNTPVICKQCGSGMMELVARIVGIRQFDKESQSWKDGKRPPANPDGSAVEEGENFCPVCDEELLEERGLLDSK